MQGYHKVPMTLTEKQFRRLKNSHAVQLKHHQISHDGQHAHHVVLHHTTAKKIHQAASKRKGARLTMTPHELEMSGAGLADFWNKLKNAGSWIKSHILDTDVYKQSVRPIVHGLVDQGINAAATIVGSKAGPQGQEIAKQIGNAAANKFYEASGVGLRRRHGGAIKGGYRPGQYGHGATQSDVDMSSSQIRHTWPASEFTPLLAPSKYPSLIQHQEMAKGSGMRKHHKVGKSGSFRLN
jgi:hypothetical protein